MNTRQRLLFFGLALLTACAAPARASSPSTQPAATPHPSPTLFPTTAPTLVPPLTDAPPTAVPTPDPLFPYTIEGLRARAYPGGPIEIVQLLEQPPTFTRYLITYPSDGLRITGLMNVPAGEGRFPSSSSITLTTISASMSRAWARARPPTISLNAAT